MLALLLTYPAIRPDLIQWPFRVRWYAIAYIAGLIAGWALIRHVVAQERYWAGAPRPSAESIDDLLTYCTLGVVVGGRLGQAFLWTPGYFWDHPLEIFEVWKGGMAFHGGMIGVLVATILFARQKHTPWLTVLDLASLAAPIGLFLGRLANFVNAELYGRPTDVPWAMIFPPSDGQPRHPSQLYEAALEGALNFAILWTMARRGALQRRGLLAGMFGVVYGLARTFSEFFRDPDPGGERIGGILTVGMAYSLPMILIGAGVVAWSLRGSAARA
jgi:phosphatidylglycerol:prolipoprotein diacylglycerol transferase